MSNPDPSAYLAAVSALEDLTSPPPAAPPSPEEPFWHWEGVAVDEIDRGLERWAWGLTGFGREVAVRAGLAVLDAVLPVWTRAAVAPPPGMDTNLDNIARGLDPSPVELRARITAYLAAPSAATVAAVAEHDQGSALDIFDVLGNPEFVEHWGDTWMFVLPAAYAAGMLVFDEERLLPRCLGNVAIAGRRALDGEHGAQAPLIVWQIMAQAFRGP